jgi:FkbM family methyltransferase
VGLREAFLDRVVSQVDRPTQVKLRWRARLRAGSAHARVMSELVGPGDTAIDIGANWGIYTIGLSELVGPDGHVIAVEPGPELVTLRAACARSRNVKIYALALSDRNGTARLAVPSDSGAGVTALGHLVEARTNEEPSIEVQVARLDTLEIPNSSRLGFVKCDVEGHEDAVLRGGEQRIREHMPSLLVEVEERHRERPVFDAFELLCSWGYVGYALTAAGLRPLGQFDVERDQLAHLVDGELLFPTPPAYINDFLFLRPGVPRPFSSSG